MKPLSLKWRIGICVTFLMLVIVVTISIVAFREFEEGLFTILDHRLRSDVSAVRQELTTEDSPEGIRQEIRAILIPEGKPTGSGYQLWFDDGRIYLSSTNLISGPSIIEGLRSPATGEMRTFHFSDNEQTYRAIWARIAARNESDPLNALIYTSSDYVHHEICEFLVALVILGGLILWLSTGVISWALNWGLKPVGRLTDLMDQVSGRHLGELTVQFPPVPQELSPFVRAWRQMLERLCEAMRQQRRFTADASHELRTPLATLKSTLQVARSHERSAAYYQQAIDHSLEDLDRLAHLIEQLLQLSRLDSLESSPDYERIDMETLVGDVCEQYALIARQQGRVLNCCLSQGAVKGQPLLLRQVLNNLLDNALQYSPPKTPITVRMETDRDRLKIIVQDEGGELSKEQRHLIFERFYRVDKARTRKTGGTGIGLSIVLEIVQKHGGEVTVSSDPQTGTQFTVTLPIIAYIRG